MKICIFLFVKSYFYLWFLPILYFRSTLVFLLFIPSDFCVDPIFDFVYDFHNSNWIPPKSIHKIWSLICDNKVFYFQLLTILIFGELNFSHRIDPIGKFSCSTYIMIFCTYLPYQFPYGESKRCGWNFSQSNCTMVSVYTISSSRIHFYHIGKFPRLNCILILYWITASIPIWNAQKIWRNRNFPQ